MPTLFVGIHLALVSTIALFGLPFLLDPCGGGGDLCLGGAVGLTSLGAAAAGAVGIFIWWAVQRASPLLVFDAALASVGGYLLVQAPGAGPALIDLGLLAITGLGLAGAALAGRAVAAHRLEPVLAVATLVGIVILAGEGGLAVLALGLLALGAGRLWTRAAAARS